jgi:O-antigen/teichoic acid export membrane protein
MKIVEVVMVIWGFYLNSVLPTLTKAFEKDDKKEIKKTLDISFKILLGFSMYFFVLWVLFRNYIIELVANKDYLTAIPYSSSDVMPIVFLVVVFYFISLLFIYIFIASKKQSILLKINIFITIFNIVWNILIIPKYSFVWSWIITLLSQIILFVICYFYSNKIVKFEIPFIYIAKILVLSFFIYIIWNYFLVNYSIWLYSDLFVYSIFLSSLYWIIVFKILKK